jgi:phage N-6-adenine-methyltransferase
MPRIEMLAASECDLLEGGVPMTPFFSSVVFSRARDDWETPPDLFEALDAEFAFTCDAAAVAATAKCARFFCPDAPSVRDALAIDWPVGRYFLNPPYSQTRAFIRHAAAAVALGSTVVCLVAARTGHALVA